MAALLVFVLLSATTIVIVAATQNQLSQTRANRQFIQGRSGVTLAVSDAIYQLNNGGPDSLPANRKTSPGPPATAVSGGEQSTKWTWWFDANTNTVNATAIAFGKTRTQRVALDYSDVASYRNDADGLPIYSVSPRGIFKDAVSVSGEQTSSSSPLTLNNGPAISPSPATPATFGMYGKSTFLSPNALQGTGGAVVVSHDDRNYKPENVQASMVQKRDGITSTVDMRIADNLAKQCATWGGAFTGGQVDTNNASVQCFTGLDVAKDTTVSILGNNVKTIVVRGTAAMPNHTFAGTLVRPSGVKGQLHIIFTMGDSWNHRLVLGNGSTASSISGLFAYAPHMPCTAGAVAPVITGSVACERLDTFKATVTAEVPMATSNDGPSARVWYVKR